MATTSTATTGTTVSTTAGLMWAPPSMSNPVIIDLSTTGNKDYWSFSSTQDVIFVGSSSVRTIDKLQVHGGHDVAVLGGDFEPASQASNGTLNISGVTGDIYIDGVTINNKSVSQDGIDVGGTSSTDVFIQNTKVLNANGAKSGVHADDLQTQGDIHNLNIYNFTGTTNYQGMFLAPQHTINAATMTNVNLSYTANTSNDGSSTTYLLWTLDDFSEKAYPITFSNVFVQPRSGQSAIASTVWPKNTMGATESNGEITWNNSNLHYTGYVTDGKPAADFADSSKIGVNFKDAAALEAAMTGTGSVSTGGTSGTGSSGTGSSGTGSSGTGSSSGSGGTSGGTGDSTTVAIASGSPTHWFKAADNSTVSLTGTDGNDQLAGRVAGIADVMSGGKGDDTYIVNRPDDVVTEKAGQGVDTVLSYSTSYTLPDHVENLTLGSGAGNATGNALANIIIGNSGDNVITGKGGNDVMTGGGGNDTFVIGKGDGADTITDFKTASGHSHVDLEGTTLSSFSAIKAAMTQHGSDVSLALGNGDSVLFKSATLSQFTAQDFTINGHASNQLNLSGAVSSDTLNLGSLMTSVQQSTGSASAATVTVTTTTAGYHVAVDAGTGANAAHGEVDVAHVAAATADVSALATLADLAHASQYVHA